MDDIKYAGFWIRFIASIIDSFILTIFFIPFSIIANLIFELAFLDQNVAVIVGAVMGAVIFAIGVMLPWLYYSALESSKLQATVGKLVLGIKVTDLQGNRITFGRATMRHFAKILSLIILCIGFLMIAFTKNKQGLHDKIASCLVIIPTVTSEGDKPVWNFHTGG